MNSTLNNILQVLKAVPRKERVVVFDADGTLWENDVGEALLRELISLKKIDRTYAEYETLHAKDPIAAYGWAVQIMKGLEERELRDVCTKMFSRDFSKRLFSYVPAFFKALKAMDAHVWICSASPRWAVEPGAALLGIPLSRVLAVDGEVENGRLTGVVHSPVTAGQGKVYALKQHDVQPLVGIGNGALDIDMLEYSMHKIAVHPRGQSQNSLIVAAVTRAWHVLEV